MSGTVEWPLNRFDAVLVAQTYPGRPMTTHHTLELDRPLPRERWVGALERLVDDYPELGSRVVVGGRGLGWARRLVPNSGRDGLGERVRERVVEIEDGAPRAMERWLAAPIELERELPIRLRIAPGRLAAQAVTLSLHHSVTDGVGALGLFDRLLRHAAGETLARRRSRPLAGYEDRIEPAPGELLAQLRRLRRPAARLVDVVDSSASGQHLALREIGPRTWARLGERSRAAGVSRTTLLWQVVATVAGETRLDDPSRPVRIVAGVDLRPTFGVPPDALGNWLGTLEHERPAHANESARCFDATALARLHAALSSARRTEQAVATAALLGALSRALPHPLASRMFRRFDGEGWGEGWPNPFTLMFAHIRPHARLCWPERLRPRRIWCASTLPRRPGLGLTFTTIAGRVSVTASCQAGVLRRATIEGFLDAVVEGLHAGLADGEAPHRRKA